MKNKLIIAISFLILFTCEKDDICEEGAAIIPRLIVTFYNAQIPEEKKSADNFLLYGIYDNNDTIYFETASPRSTDSIIVPLKTNTNLTTLYFHKDIDVNADDIMESGNSDAIDFSYTRQEVYISRACGYIYNYFDLNPSIVSDSSNWILSTEIISSTIENEIESHVKIFH